MPVKISRLTRNIALSVTTLIVMAVLWLAVAPPLEWIGTKLAAMARQQGVPVRSLKVEGLGLRGIHLREVTLETEPPLVLPEIIVQYDHTLLTQRRVGEIELRGMALPLTQKDGTWQARWLDALTPAATDASETKKSAFPTKAQLEALPFRKISVTESRILIDGDMKAEIPFNVTLDREQAEQLEVKVSETPLQVGDISLPPLTLHIIGQWQENGANLRFEMKDTRNHILVNASVKADGKGALEYDAVLSPLTFTPDFQPASLFPPAMAYLTGVDGSVEAKASGEQQGDLWKHEATLILKDLGGAVNGIPVKGIRGEIDFKGLPFATDGTQNVTVKSVGLGTPLQDGQIEFSLKEDTLRIPRTEWQWLGGSVRAEKLRFTLGKEPSLETDVIAKDLSLESMLGLLEQGRISATGTLSGTLPVQWKKGEFTVNAGEMTASGGHLGYADATQVVPGEGAQAELVRAALENLDYSVLRLTIGALGGETESVQLYVEGRNPDLLSGKPVHLTVNLTGDLMDTIRSSFQAYASPQKLLESTPDAKPVP